jgi:methylthioribose-1-phosphate isomerase
LLAVESKKEFNMIKTVEWISEQPGAPVPGHPRIIDQTLLPGEIRYLDLHSPEETWTAIKTLQVRGAPAIGVAAAMGLAVAVLELDCTDTPRLMAELNRIADYLAGSRPTAVNLFWALDRLRSVARASAQLPPTAFKRRLVEEALAIYREDLDMCRAIGRHALTLLDGVDTVLTHCNAGGLATSLYGTALAPIYLAHEQGRTLRVFADETRPLLQGARLTAWELNQAGIPVTLICDNMAARVMFEGKIQAVLVGADRIAANGDTANKIGTYGVAVSARHHGIPFYVLAPTSTVDLNLPDGSGIPIEERDSEEIACGFGRRTAPEGISFYNPAFDVTPAALITAIICEKGVARGDFRADLARWATKS